MNETNPQLTKREYFAIKIMAGFAAAPDTAGTIESQARYAVIWADELIKALDTNNEENHDGN